MNEIENQYKLPFTSIKILSEYETEELVNNEPGKWHVVSIWRGDREGDRNLQPKHHGAKSFCQKIFHNIQREEKNLILCNKWHIETVLDYCRNLYDTNESIIFHCSSGINRSSALCYLVLLDYLKEKFENPVEDALNLLINIKSWNVIYPNKYIIGLGMNLLAKTVNQELEWNKTFYNSIITQRIYDRKMYG